MLFLNMELVNPITNVSAAWVGNVPVWGSDTYSDRAGPEISDILENRYSDFFFFKMLYFIPNNYDTIPK